MLEGRCLRPRVGEKQDLLEVTWSPMRPWWQVLGSDVEPLPPPPLISGMAEQA